MYRDDNPDLHRQMGCMHGFFQMFDKNNFAVGRCISGLSHKRITSGHASSYNRSSSDSKGTTYAPKIVLDKNLSKSLNENPGVSIDSSRASWSSISSSSLSSAELNKSVHQDASFDRTFFRQKSSKSSDFETKWNDPEVGSNTTPRRDVLDFRNAVKGSMQRDIQPLSIKTSTKESVGNERAKYVDSPRPAVVPKTSSDGVRPNFSPRFSCDGRELSRQPTDSQGNVKSLDKHGRFSRLSLDSRDSSPAVSNYYSRANSLLDDSDLEQDRFRRSPSVVARLMGLDELPDTPKATETLSCSPKSNFSDSATQKLSYWSMQPKATPTTDGTTPVLQQEQDSIIQNAEKNASVYSEIQKRLQQLELYHTNKDLRVLKQLLGSMKEKDLAKRVGTSEKSTELSSTKDYHSEHSEKEDHRAKRLVISPKRMAKTNSTLKALSSPIVIMKPAKSLDKPVASVYTPVGSLGLPKLRTNNADDGTKVSKENGYYNGQSPKLGHRELDVLVLLATDKQYGRQYREDHSQKSPSHSSQSSHRPQDSRLKDVTSSTSPRLSKQEAEKKSSSATSPTLNKVQIQLKSRQVDEQSTQASKVRAKRYAQKEDSQACDIVNEKKIDIFRRNKNVTGLGSTSDGEIDSITTMMQKKLSFLQQYIQTPPNKNSKQAENDTKTTEIANISTALHSPVSVLDPSLLQDASENSPVKELPDSIKDDISQELRVQCHPASLLETQLTELNTEQNAENSENAEVNQVQKLEKLSSEDNEPRAADCKNQDHKYLSEILAATGLLSKDRKCSGLTCSNPSRPHSSRSAINPDMFYVLEQSQHDGSTMLEPVQEHGTKTKLSPQKLHRRLVFDVVNEILTNRIELVTFSSLPRVLLRNRKQSGEQLLQELYSEIEKLQAKGIKLAGSDDEEDDDNCTSAEDVACQSGWDLGKERAELALGVERLILRDLIDETINGMIFSI